MIESRVSVHSQLHPITTWMFDAICYSVPASGDSHCVSVPVPAPALLIVRPNALATANTLRFCLEHLEHRHI